MCYSDFVSGTHPAVINRMLSSDNQDRKQAPVPLSLKTGPLEAVVALSTHPRSDLPSLNTPKKTPEEVLNGFGILRSLLNNIPGLTSEVNHPGLSLNAENKCRRTPVVIFFSLSKEER